MMKGYDISNPTGGCSPAFHDANPDLRTKISRRKSLSFALDQNNKFTGPIYLAVLNYNPRKHSDPELRSMALANKLLYPSCLNAPTLYQNAKDAHEKMTLLIVFDTNAWFSARIELRTRVVLFDGKTYYPVSGGFRELPKK